MTDSIEKLLMNPISGGGLRGGLFRVCVCVGGGGGSPPPPPPPLSKIHNNGRGGDVTCLDYKVILGLPNYVIYFALTSLFC